MSFRLALVQPMSSAPPDDERNVEQAVRFVEEAASHGAGLVVFPESYPGPWRMPAAFDPREAMEEAARRWHIYVQYGTLEPLDDSRRAHNLLMLARPDGREAGKYRRTHPPGPWIYTGGEHWDFEYVPGDEFPTFETEHGTIGLAMCSEAYMPEVTRALALRGAEILVMPAGTDKKKLWATWRNLIWARAIENLAIVATTQNIFDTAERGLAMVAAPEEILFESEGPGVFYVDVDLARIRELRSREDTATSSLTEGAKAGILTQWQRPEMYGRFFPA